MTEPRHVFSFVLIAVFLGGCASFEPPPRDRTGPPVSTESSYEDRGESGVEVTDPPPPEERRRTDRQSLEKLRNRRFVEVERKDHATIITVDSSILFDLRSANVRREAWPTLDEVAKYLARVDDRWMLVAGHTDDLPTRTRRYPSNWELSALRAVNVVKYLSNLETLDESNLIAAGFGEHHPIASNKTEEGREKNRRIEVFLLKEDFTGGEYPGR